MEHTPTRRMANGKPKPTWMTAETRRASKDKSKAWNRYYFTKDNDRLKDFKRIRNRTTNLIRDAKETLQPMLERTPSGSGNLLDQKQRSDQLLEN